MRNIKMICIVLITAAVGQINVHAQVALPATGSNAAGSGGSVSFSVGQIAYTTHAATNGSVLQGVQQPYDISVVSGVDEMNGNSYVISVYPNPAADFLQLKVESEKLNGMGFQLFNMQGELLEENQLTDFLTQINTGNLLAGPYLLKVNQHNNVVKIFKIVKN